MQKHRVIGTLWSGTYRSDPLPLNCFPKPSSRSWQDGPDFSTVAGAVTHLARCSLERPDWDWLDLGDGLVDVTNDGSPERDGDRVFFVQYEVRGQHGETVEEATARRSEMTWAREVSNAA